MILEMTTNGNLIMREPQNRLRGAIAGLTADSGF